MRYRRFLFLILLLLITGSVYEISGQERVSPGKAFAKSLVLPGWGHYSVDSENWRRGQIHLGAETALIASFFGFRGRSIRIETQYETLARLKAGVNVEGRGRSFQIAVGDFNSLDQYNDFQLRSRRWNRLFEPIPENEWNWLSDSDRLRYNELRSERDKIINQLPAVISLMVANRVIAGISAYNRARDRESRTELAFLPLSAVKGETGFLAMIVYRF